MTRDFALLLSTPIETLPSVEDVQHLTAEIALPEDVVRRVSDGQQVRLRPRGLAAQTVSTQVRQVATTGLPAADVNANLPSTITVVCDIPNSVPHFRPGMTGFARIATGRRAVAQIIGDRVRHYLQTEFWW